MHKSEKVWLTLSFGMIMAFMFATGYQTFALGITPPGGKEVLDPQKVDQTAPFDQPGVKQIGENEYEVVMTMQIFSFTPAKLEFPAGATVHFVLTSKDVVHGFQVVGTNANAMVLPGHVTRVTQTFSESGEYLVLCNEYCGAGHQMMSTTITVK